MRAFRRLAVMAQIILIGATLSAAFVPAIAAAAPAKAATVVRNVPMQLVSSCSPTHPLGLDPWYEYLHEYKSSATGECAVCFNVTNGANFDKQDCPQSKVSSIPLILFAVVNDLLRIAGIIAVGYVFYGAIQYTTSQGNPDETARAQGTVVNALIGVAIASVAVALVSFLGSKLGG